MKRIYIVLLTCSAIIGIGLIPSIRAQGSDAFRVAVTKGIQTITGTGTGTRVLPTPYLRSTNITTAITVVPKTTVGVLGCVIIGVAGAAGSTIKIYNGPTAIAGNILANIDGTQVGQPFCYGMIFNHGGGFAVAVASGGIVPDVTVTWR